MRFHSENDIVISYSQWKANAFYYWWKKLSSGDQKFKIMIFLFPQSFDLSTHEPEIWNSNRSWNSGFEYKFGIQIREK